MAPHGGKPARMSGLRRPSTWRICRSCSKGVILQKRIFGALYPERAELRQSINRWTKAEIWGSRRMHVLILKRIEPEPHFSSKRPKLRDCSRLETEKKFPRANATMPRLVRRTGVPRTEPPWHGRTGQCLKQTGLHMLRPTFAIRKNRKSRRMLPPLSRCRQPSLFCLQLRYRLRSAACRESAKTQSGYVRRWQV